MARRRTIAAKRLKMGGLSKGAARRGQRDDWSMPGFRSPRAGKHSKIPGRGSHKAKP